jgi:ribonuclease Z
MQLEAAKGKLAFDLNFYTIEPSQSGVLFEDDKVEVRCFPLVHKIPTSGFRISEKERERTLLIDKATKDEIRIEFFHKLKAGLDVVQDGKKVSFMDYTSAPPPVKSYAYCSDTAYSEHVIDSVKHVSVLYHEATFIEKLRDRAEATRHTTAKDAAAVAKAANVGRLLLGHISARYDSGELHVQEAQTVFSEVTCVEDGQVIHIDKD